MRLFLRALPLLTPLLLAACGGGGGVGGGDGGSASSHAGTFFDAPTQGLQYTAAPSGLGGTTTADGTFRFNPGDTVSFALPLGPGQLLALGSYRPGRDGDIVSVLALPQGAAIAQILQSLDHSGSADHLDVGGIALPAADFAALRDYLATAGIAGPGQADGQQLLADAQQHAAGALVFRQPGAVTAYDAMNTARQALSDYIAAHPVTASLPAPAGRVVLFSGHDNFGPNVRLVAFGELDAANWHSDAYYMSAVTDYLGNTEGNTTYHVYDAGVIDVGAAHSFSGDATSGVYTYTGYNFMQIGQVDGAGAYRVLPATTMTLRGKLVTVSGLGDCEGAPVTFAFVDDDDSISAYSWSAYCGAQAEVLAAVAPQPVAAGKGYNVDNVTQVDRLYSPDCERTRYLGLLEGSVAAGGALVRLSPPRVSFTAAAGFAETARILEVGTAPSRLLRPTADTCSAYTGTPLAGL